MRQEQRKFKQNPSEKITYVSEILQTIIESVEEFDYKSSMQNNMSDISFEIRSSNKKSVSLASSIELQEMVDTVIAKPAYKIPQLVVQYKILCARLAHLVAKKVGHPFFEINDQLHVWNGIYFSRIANDAALKNFFRGCGERSGIPKYIIDNVDFLSKMKAQFTSLCYFSKQDHKGRILINLLNGTLEISNGKCNLRAHSAQDLLTYVLPLCYNPAARATKWESHLARVLPDKTAQMVLAEHFGYTFVPTSELKLEKALVLYGDGANGKSVCHDVITHLLGKDNITHYSLENLCSSSGYYRAMIANKLLNYCTELSSKMNTDYFKKLASGEPVDVRSVYEKPSVITDYAKLVFNCNELPQNLNTGAAYFRRLNILRFDVIIPEAEQDKLFATKIISNELEGVFNWILDGLIRLISQKNFTVCKSSIEQVALYKKENDNVQLFIEDTGFAKDPTEKMPVDELFTLYYKYCKTNRYTAYAKNIFSKRLKTIGFVLQRDSRRSNVFIRSL